MSIRTLFTALAFATLLVSTACLPDGVKQTLQTVGECSGQAAGDVATTIQRLLLSDGELSPTISDGVSSELMRIAEQHGPELVRCLVQNLVFKAKSTPAASTDRNTILSAERGEQFLESEAFKALP